MMILGSSRVAMRTTDVLVVGFLGAWATASIGLGDVWLRLVLFIGLGLGAGTVARVSQSFGREEYEEADRTMTQAALLSVIVGTAATVILWFFGPELIRLLGAEDRLVREGGAYLKIVGLSAVPRVFYLVSLRGMGAAEDTVKPAIIGVSTTLLNIFITVVLVFGWIGLPKMGVTGAAVGTFTGNTLAGLSCLVLLNTNAYRLNLCRSGLGAWKRGWEIVRIGVPRIFTGGIVAAGRVPLHGILLWFGEAAVAAFQIGLRVLILAMMPNWGISAAAGTYTGQHLGKGEPEQAQEQGWIGVRLSLLISGPITALLIFFRDSVAYLFIREQPALDLAAQFILIYGFVMIMYCFFKNLSGALEGAGHTIVPMLAAGSGMAVLLVLSGIAAGPLDMSIRAVYGSILLGYVIRTVIVIGWYQSYSWAEHPAVLRARSPEEGS
jgi:putative MATE family efflux protein